MMGFRPLARIILIGMVPFCALQARQSFVNFSHLEHLTEQIVLAGDTVSIVHVYANYPSYAWTDAKESGPEGIACVDDAARAAVMYCRHYELNRDQQSLRAAKSLLRFVIAMQTDDGDFYNFLLADHSINRDGKTSFKSFGWWAARGVWAMATGSRVMQEVDPAFAAALHDRVKRTFPHVDSLMRHYGSYRMAGGYRIPEWLLYESGADVTSELLFGLVEYYRVEPDQKVKQWIRNLSDGLIMMQNGDVRTYPYGLHRSWQTLWHIWGNGQTQALAAAGRILKNQGMVQSAEREAKGFYTRLLVDGYRKEMDVIDSTSVVRYEQIAYGIRPMAVGLLRLYEATKNETYLKMAGLAASWLFGNNVLQQRMYDTATGRCFDGIIDSVRLNKNSGAESTIEALMTLTELEQYPGARKYLGFRLDRTGDNERYHFATFRSNESGEELTLGVDRKKKSVVLLEGKDHISFQMRNNTP